MSESSCCCRKPNEASPSDESDETKKSSQDVAPSKKTILFVPLDCIGHVNSLISIADSLKSQGHRTVFLFYDPMDGGLSKHGHEVYDCTTEGLVASKPTEASEKKWDMIVNEMGKLWRSSLMDNFTQTTLVGLGSMMKDIIKNDEIVEQKLKLIKPDLIIIDHYFIQPALIKYGKPWARIYSASPLALHPKRHRLPPATLGLPTDWWATKDLRLKSTYEDYARRVDEVKMELYDEFNEYVTQQHKLDNLPLDPLSYIYDSPYLNLYMYPEELDYVHLPNPPKWVRCDSILRLNAKLPEDSSEDLSTQLETFEIPDELMDKPGKLILLSMGSLASGDVELMKRLVSILSKSPNRFIVNRGPNWDKYELAPNMWGEKFLPQLSILPKIDLIITHGDQYDNAQRIEEQRLGRRVDAFHCSEDELLSAIEEVLNDATIRERMQAIKERMQKPENKFKSIKLFRELIDKI